MSKSSKPHHRYLRMNQSSTNVRTYVRSTTFKICLVLCPVAISKIEIDSCFIPAVCYQSIITYVH